MKKRAVILTAIIIFFCSTTTPVSAATHKPSLLAKSSRSETLITRKSIEDTYKTAVQAAQNQLNNDLKEAKNLKGKSKAAATKAAHSKQQSTIKAAKERRKLDLQSLVSKK